MIVPMRKVSLFILDKHRQECLLSLRRLGVLHVRYRKPPSSSEIERLEKEREKIERALWVLSRYPRGGEPRSPIGREEVLLCAEQIISLDAEKDNCMRDRQDIDGDISWYKDWGTFSLNSLKELSREGIRLRFYRCSRRQLKSLQQDRLIQMIKRQGNSYYIVDISLIEEDRAESAAQEIGLQEIIPPSQDLQTLQDRLKITEQRVSDIDSTLRERSSCRGELLDYLRYLNKSLEFNRVKSGMQQEGEISYLEGFIPAEDVSRFIRVARAEGWAYLIQEPDKPEEVPTLIRNPRWLRIIEPVFKFMGTVPGYNEYDTSFSFLLFFSLFFALLIGDGGYGLIFLAITYLVRRRMRAAAPEPFILMYVLALVTIAWGALSGTWFGYEGIAQLPFLRNMVIDRINSFIDSNQSFMMRICFLIGAVHLTMAHGIIALRAANSLRCLAQIGWMLVIWSLFFISSSLVLGEPLFKFTPGMFSGGLLMILLFSHPQRNILKALGLTLQDLPLRIVNSFSDIISYLRLFAVGYASVAVAVSFNNMALRIGFSNILISFISASILFLGHALNIILGLMAVVVHGIRLNMLEFSSHLGMQWSGTEYRPFKE